MAMDHDTNSVDAHAPEDVAGSLTLFGAVSLGTGVMIGAGIFAITGQAAGLAGDLFPVAFLVAAIVVMAARSYQAAMMLARQVEFALFDLRLHSEWNPANGASVQDLLDEVRAAVAVVPTPAYNRFQNSFSHIFAGGYAAGYYSYKWAEVLSADAFSRFEEEGIFNRDTGESFRQHILHAGGSRDAMELFIAFRGREPSLEPLLRHSGIATPAAA